MKTKKTHTILAALAGTALSISASNAAITVAASPSSGTVALAGWDVGMYFSPNQTIWVTDLGKLDGNGSGLGADTNVALYEVAATPSGGALIGSTRLAFTTVLTTATAETNGDFEVYYNTIAPVELDPAKNYFVVAADPGNESWTRNGTVTLASEISFVSGSSNGYAVNGGGDPFGATITTNNGGSAYFGANFKFDTVNPIPEPSSAALLGLGGLALMLRRRK